MRVTWSPEATAQVDAILRQIGEQSPTQADRWLSRLLRIVGQIESLPASGRVIERFDDQNVRYRLHGKYHIAYLLHGSSVEIAAVWHGARRPPGSGIAATYGDEE